MTNVTNVRPKIRELERRDLVKPKESAVQQFDFLLKNIPKSTTLRITSIFTLARNFLQCSHEWWFKKAPTDVTSYVRKIKACFSKCDFAIDNKIVCERFTKIMISETLIHFTESQIDSFLIRTINMLRLKNVTRARSNDFFKCTNGTKCTKTNTLSSRNRSERTETLALSLTLALAAVVHDRAGEAKAALQPAGNIYVVYCLHLWEHGLVCLCVSVCVCLYIAYTGVHRRIQTHTDARTRRQNRVYVCLYAIDVGML